MQTLKFQMPVSPSRQLIIDLPPGSEGGQAEVAVPVCRAEGACVRESVARHMRPISIRGRVSSASAVGCARGAVPASPSLVIVDALDPGLLELRHRPLECPPVLAR